MNIKAVTLQSKINGASKEYSVQLAEVDGGYLVNYQNGRIGGSMTNGTKTAAPVTLEAATKLFDKLVKEKMTGSSAYQPVGEVSAGFTENVNVGIQAGVSPQLLNYTEESDLQSLINDDQWVAQEKFDGENRMVLINAQGVSGVNKKGLLVALPVNTNNDLQSFDHKLSHGLLSAEIIGEDLYVFDLLEANGIDLRNTPYELRLKALYALLKEPTRHIHAISTAYTSAQKQALFDRIKAEGGEGVVFKRKDAKFIQGKQHSDQLKFKFYDECTVIVEAVNQGVRSVSMMMLDGDQKIPVGSVTIPPNKSVPAANDVLEVKYLYAYQGGSLFQPQYQKPRNDVDHAECQISQLKYKQAPKLKPGMV